MFGKINVGRFLICGLFLISSYAVFVNIHDEPPFRETLSANSSEGLTQKTKYLTNTMETIEPLKMCTNSATI